MINNNNSNEYLISIFINISLFGVTILKIVLLLYLKYVLCTINDWVSWRNNYTTKLMWMLSRLTASLSDYIIINMYHLHKNNDSSINIYFQFYQYCEN